MANDRFKTGKMPKCNQWNNPGPSAYQVKNSLNENFNSTHNYMGATKIGNDKLDFQHVEWLMHDKKQLPGPGAYARFSDFSGIEKVKAVAQVQPTETRQEDQMQEEEEE